MTNKREIRFLLAVAVAGSAMAMLLRYYFLPYVSGDARNFLIPWFTQLKEDGGFKALADYPGNYNAPYMVILALLTYLPFDGLLLIKAVSIVFDYILAASCGLLVKELTGSGRRAVTTYLCILFLPTVFVNSAWWAQCDSVYTAFGILSLYALVKEKYPASFVLLGCSFAFKLQFIFFLPVFIIVWFCKRKFPLWYFLIIPAMDLLLCVPALAAGMPFSKIFSIYMGQTQTYSYALVLNFPNIYQLIPADRVDMQKTIHLGIVISLAFFFVLLLHCMKRRDMLTRKNVIFLSLISTLACVCLLPCMHERYGFPAEVLMIICLAIEESMPAMRSLLPAAGVIETCPILTYGSFLCGWYMTDLFPVMSLFYMTAFVWMIWLFARKMHHGQGKKEKEAAGISSQ